MNIEQARDQLDGMDRSVLPSADLVKALRQNNLVAAYCPDPKRVWVFGVVRGEYKVNQGVVISRDGVTEAENDDEPGFLRALENEGPEAEESSRFYFETNSPHKTFSVFSGDEVFCLGAIFHIDDI